MFRPCLPSEDSGLYEGNCLVQNVCCPPCDSAPEIGYEGPRLPCARAVYAVGEQGPNWRSLEYDLVTGWCGRAECYPQPCPNSLYCGKAWPRWLLEAHGGRCMNCAIDFGFDLRFHDGQDCAVCYEPAGIHVGMPQCTHSLCVDCFRRICPHDPDSDDETPGGAPLISCPLCRAHYRGPYDPEATPRGHAGAPPQGDL